jgi:hypothetical protein
MEADGNRSPMDRLLHPEEDLEELYRSWEILDLVGETVAAMPPSWLVVLNLARNLLDGRALPGIEMPPDLARLVGTPRDNTSVVVRRERWQRMVNPLGGDTRVQPLRALTDFPKVTLPDMMLRDVAPGLFDYQLLSGGIHGVYTTGLTPAIEEYDEIVEERIPAPGPGRKKRQKVYALLDVSNSMRDDNRILFAKALLLAYLVTAHREGAEIYFRTFGNTVHARSDCAAPGDFAQLARRILAVTPEGSTDIKHAMDTAIFDIRALDGFNRVERLGETPPTELLLISDCESYSIPVIPKAIKLHTVHLKGARMMKIHAEGFERIRAESRTFHEIDTTALVLPETTRERWLLRFDGRALDDARADAGTEGAQHRPGAAHRQAVREAYRRMTGQAKERRPVRLQPGRALSPAKPGFGALLRALWRLLRHPWPHRRGLAAPAQPLAAAAPFGLQFRVRK